MNMAALVLFCRVRNVIFTTYVKFTTFQAMCTNMITVIFIINAHCVATWINLRKKETYKCNF